MKRALPILAATALLPACSGAPTSTNPEGVQTDQGQYVTGSRIPRKADPAVKTLSREEFGRARNESMGNPPSPQRSN